MKQKKAPGAFDLLRPESFSCDHAFLSRFLSICAYGMPSIEVRLPVAAPSRTLSGLPLRVVIEGLQDQSELHFDGLIG